MWSSFGGKAARSAALAGVVAAHLVNTAAGQTVSVQPRGVVLPAASAPVGANAERSAEWSVARRWNEELLAAIRRDNPRPPVVTRYLYHVSAAMYDAWAAYDDTARGVFRDEWASADDTEAAREEAISHAAYLVMRNRFATSPGAATTLPALDALMADLGYDPMNASLVGASPAAVGNRIAASIIAQTQSDGANQADNYADTSGYTPFNGVLVVENPGTGGMLDVNRWQPLLVPGAVLPQRFLTPHWDGVRPFAMQRPAPGALYIDPGQPPLLGGEGDAEVRADLVQLIEFSSHLDPTRGAMINISPSVVGNNPLGTQDGTGHAINPATGLPYPDLMVNRGDWGRVLAEFWADGPLSSTPPGHWNEIANEVTEHPGLERRFRGEGPELPLLEWDVKKYLALNGGVHDVAIATWEVKAFYDYARPISMIRELASRGVSADGLPVIPGLIEEITIESSAPGERHEHLAAYVGEIALYAWRGHPGNPATEFGGAGWIRGVEWLPYQQRTFVTPPFAGYTSGHSGFSRSSAETLALLTGTPFFPGGEGVYLASTGTDGFDLGFEFGPSADVRLTWATYYDAADEAGISRIYGGIHPAIDDFPGRRIGHQAGTAAFEHAEEFFTGAARPACPADLVVPFAQYTIFDILAYLAVYLDDAPGADFNSNGVTDVMDVVDFLNTWHGGCN